IQDTSSPAPYPFTVFGISGATGSGTGTVTVPAASVTGTQTIVATGNGNDVLTVDLSAGNPIRSGGLTFDGGNPATSPGDSLIITGGSQGQVTYTLNNATDGQIVMSSVGTINFTGVETISNGGTATDLTFNLPAGPNSVTLADDGATGNALSRLSGATI